MAWDFETEADFEAKLAWTRRFVDEEVLPLETLADVWRAPGGAARYTAATAPLKEEVRRQGLWAAHLPPELGGNGFGQVKLGLMHEILGRSELAPAIFGNNAPDSGNAELLALGGTPEQKARWMHPLLEGKLRSGYSMTEPGAGAYPTMLTTEAVRDGDEWVINGHKWFTSNASVADFLIVMCRTNPDPEGEARSAYSMIVVPATTPGVEVVRDIPCMSTPDPVPGMPGNHGEVVYRDVRVPFDHLVGGEEGLGQGFVLAQKRLGPGRIHHAMRWLGQCQRAFDTMCERAVSRRTAGSLLADKQMIQEMVAESWAQMQAARLVTLHAAWKMDKLVAAGGTHSDARLEIAVVKFWGARVLHDVIDRSIQVYGSLGYSSDLPLESMYRRARAARILDGPDEVHKVTVARQLFKRYRATEVPTEHVPTRREHAVAKLADVLDLEAVNS